MRLARLTAFGLSFRLTMTVSMSISAPVSAGPDADLLRNYCSLTTSAELHKLRKGDPI